MIEVTSAAIYSMNGCTEMAYEIGYSEGTKVRAVESAGNIIRAEHMGADGKWVSGKAYVVKHSKVRTAERLKRRAVEFLAN